MNTDLIDRRNGLMAVLSAAEHFVSTSPVIPYDIALRNDGLDMMVRHSTGDVLTIAAAFELEVTFRDHGRGRPMLEAKGLVSGVPVRVWTLGDADDWDEYEAAVPVLLPREWSARVSA